MNARQYKTRNCITQVDSKEDTEPMSKMQQEPEVVKPVILIREGFVCRAAIEGLLAVSATSVLD